MSETPISSAKALFSQYSITEPTDVPIEDLIWAQGGIYQEKPMTGAEGRIIFGSNNSAIIVVNSSISYPEKIRFVRAHELGHFRLHRNLQPFFHCDSKAFIERNRKGSHESEANAFAAELLMPEHLVRAFLKDEPFCAGLIKRMAERFQTSLMTTAIRYTEVGTEPVAVFFSRNGIIEWSDRSDEFIARKLLKRAPLPINSSTYRRLAANASTEGPELIAADVWFDSRKIPGELLFYEDCIPMRILGGALTFLWMSNQYK